MTSSRFLTLLPQHRVDVIVAGTGGGRFVALFQLAWTRIPLYARRAVLKYWREGLGPAIPCPPPDSPNIVLTDVPIRLTKTRGAMNSIDPELWAKVSCNGHEMTFWSPVINHMPDHLVQDLVAHELAHVFQFARDDSVRRRGMGGGGIRYCTWQSPIVIEVEANEIAEDWGFNSSAMDEWAPTAGPMESAMPPAEQLASTEFERNFAEMRRTLGI